MPWIGGYADQVPAGINERREWLAKQYEHRWQLDARTTLEKYYGKQKAAAAKYVEAFEICEYGTQLDEAAIKKMFPMLGR